ncbi:hypothetical protein MPSEU_001093600 [Mayamaea pseudoterrestris]|nr:hypothetical protein MPSEU_001093600 [Mayamaea pseudoterrestris]
MDHIESFEDSCLAAQRAAVESLKIGRNTLEQAQQQSEQLVRASTIADDTKYDLDHAARLLKNMTWTGWLSNKLSKEPMIAKNVTVKNDASRFNGAGGAGPTTATANRQTPSTMLDDNLTLIDNVPKSHQAAAQSLSNYRANLRVLQDFCENNINQPIDNEEEKQQLTTLQTICNAMYETARVQLEKLQSDCTAATTARDDETIRCALHAELRQLREQQMGLQSRRPQRTSAKPTSQQSLVLQENNGRVEQQQQLEQAATPVAVNIRSSVTMKEPAATKLKPSASQLQEQMQGDHLQFLSSNLEELGQLAQHLNHAVVSSVRTMDHLEDQSESILEQTKHVTRRADRMARHSNRSWFSSRSAGSRHLLGQVAICHVESGYYMRMWNGTVFLVPDFDKASCLLGIYVDEANWSWVVWIGRNQEPCGMHLAWPKLVGIAGCQGDNVWSSTRVGA